MHAVAHGEAVLVFRVVFFRRGGRGLCGRGVHDEGGAEQKYPAESYEGNLLFFSADSCELYRSCLGDVSVSGNFDSQLFANGASHEPF
jgi:hypothetical protein